MVGKKLYVGDLPYSISSSDLEQCFRSSGRSRAQVIEDRETGRSKGFGFVEMGSDKDAQAAITGLNGQDHGGRPLTVNEAKLRRGSWRWWRRRLWPRRWWWRTRWPLLVESLGSSIGAARADQRLRAIVRHACPLMLADL